MEDLEQKIVVIVDDDRHCLPCTQRRIEKWGYFVIAYNNPQQAYEDIEMGLLYHALIVDSSFEGFGPFRKNGKLEGSDLAALSKQLLPSVPVIGLSGQNYRIEYTDITLCKPDFVDELQRELSLLLNSRPLESNSSRL